MSVEKLAKKLEERGVRLTGITWGPDAGKYTADERAAEVLKSIEELERFQALPLHEQMLHDITDAYWRLSIGDDDGAAVILGNWVDVKKGRPT